MVGALPLLLSGPAIRVPTSAQAIGRTMTVVCLITTTGTVTDCDVVRGGGLAEATVLAGLRARTYRPAQLDGRSVAVRHEFQVDLAPNR